MTAHPSFPTSEGGAFLRDVKARAEQYFAAAGRSAKGDGRMLVKTICMLALTFVPYLLILSGRFPVPVMALLALMSGFGMAGIGFAVAHDALHGGYATRPWVNRMLGYTMDLIGASSYLWKITHNIIHHTYTNIHGTDEDLAVSPLLRLSPHAPRKGYHRYQHFYALPLYAMTTLFWVFLKDYQQLLRKDLGPYVNRSHRPRDVIGLLAGKTLYYGWALVLPLAILPLPWWQVLIGFLLAHVAAGFTLGIVFQLAHVVEKTAHPEPDAAGAMGQHWAVHEMETTANFAPSNRLLGWYVGGLNYQVEHHLFPRVCSIHYPALSRIVEATADRHGLPYHSYRTFTGAIASHLRTLRRFGASDQVVELATPLRTAGA